MSKNLSKLQWLLIRLRWLWQLVLKNKFVILALAPWLIFMFITFWQMVYIKDGALWIAHEYAWGDWALHVSMAGNFAFREPADWFTWHPVYAGKPLSYPFLGNLIAGLIWRTGASVQLSFFIPSIITAVLLILVIYLIARRLGNSKPLSVLSVYLFFLSAGLGFSTAVQNLLSGIPFDKVIIGTEYYSRNEALQWLGGNVLVALLIPQRAFLLGITMALWVIWALLAKKMSRNKKIFWGLFSGLIIIAHAHSFLVLILLSAVILAVKAVIAKVGINTHLGRKKLQAYIKEWLWFVIPAGIVSVILYLLFIRTSVDVPDFMKFQPGWSVRTLPEWFELWWQAWGFSWVALLLGVLAVLPYKYFGLRAKGKLQESEKYLVAFILGGIGLFIISNLFLLQPIGWDNSKIFTWIYLCIVFTILPGFKFLIDNKGAFLVPILIIACCFTGFLDLYRATDHILFSNYMLIESAGVKAATYIRENLPADAVMVSTPRTHNSIGYVLSGRTLLAGYSSWLLNYGFDYRPRELDIENIYKTPDAAVAEGIIEKYKNQFPHLYLVVTPYERSNYLVNDSELDKNFQKIYSENGYTVYEL